MADVKIMVYSKKHTVYPSYATYKGQEYWKFEEKLNQDQIEKGEKGWEIVIEKKHPCFKEIDLRAKWDEDKMYYCSIYELTFDADNGYPRNNNPDNSEDKERWFDKKNIIKIAYTNNNDNRERERERERERAKLPNSASELLN